MHFLALSQMSLTGCGQLSPALAPKSKCEREFTLEREQPRPTPSVPASPPAEPVLCQMLCGLQHHPPRGCHYLIPAPQTIPPLCHGVRNLSAHMSQTC